MTEITLNQLRVFHLASQEIVPLINDLHARAYDDLLMQFRTHLGNDTLLLPMIAKCAAYREILDDINARSTMYANRANKKDPPDGKS